MCTSGVDRGTTTIHTYTPARIPGHVRLLDHDESATHAHGRELHTYSAAVHTTPEVLGRTCHAIFAKGSASLPDDGAEWRPVPIRAVERADSKRHADAHARSQSTHIAHKSQALPCTVTAHAPPA